MKLHSARILPALFFSVLFGHFSFGQSDLLTNFQNPPNAARPRVWWHWMNGNVTKNGIQKDLEWMQRVGEATGLEVDKLDKDAVRKYINAYLDMHKDATGGVMGSRGLQYMILDS